jgi:DNA polymerase III sliding clamp (beta) subunit (PCNA family)
MKINIKQIELEKLLKIHFENLNSFLEDVVFSCIHLSVKNKTLSGVSTNKKISIKTTTKNLFIEEEGEILINLTTLFNLISKFNKSDELNIYVLDNNLIINSKNSTTNLLINDLNDLYGIDFESKSPFSIPFDVLDYSCNKLINCITLINQNRQILTGINFNNNESKLTCIGASTTFLASYNSKIQSSEFNITIPQEVFKLISNKISKNTKCTFYIKNNTNIIINFDDTIINSLLLTETFPKINILNEIKGDEVVVEKNLFLNTINQASAINNLEKNPTLTLTISNNKIQIYTKSTNKGTFFTELPAIYEINKDEQFNLNIKNLTTLLKNIDDEKVKIVFQSANQPIFILNPTNPNYTSIIQPIK